MSLNTNNTPCVVASESSQPSTNETQTADPHWIPVIVKDSFRPDDAQRLIHQRAGVEFQVCHISATQGDAVRLKRMGICVGRRVQLVQAGDPSIVRVVGCRVGVSRRLAECIFVLTDRQG